MKNSTFSKLKLKIDDPYDPAHLFAIQELLDHPDVQSMDLYIHHGSITCLKHCLCVSYYSYRLAERWHCDKNAVARGALLHDFYLYDWHKKENRKGLHGFTHASHSLANAQLRFSLSPMEKDIIKKHMWPMQPRLPRYKESFLVCFVDKMISLMETFHLIQFKSIQRIFPAMMIIYPR